MMMEDDRDFAAHLSDEDVAAYLDGAVTPADRQRIEAHLAECAECRVEVVEVTRELRTNRRAFWRVAAPLAAAAAVVALVFLGPGLLEHDSGRVPSSRERGTLPDGEGTPNITVMWPARGGEVSASGLEFGWRTLGLTSSYRLTLTDESGSTLWVASTTDTVLPLPDTLRLESDRVYFWYVDALLADGRSATSGVRSFTVAR